ncbi:MAG: hypothetical protein P4L40_03410 [Terracidiphilus sp.]|nr:hypothetical protein [Terracidiphilus sp.]
MSVCASSSTYPLQALRRDGFTAIPPNYFPLALCAYIAVKLVFPWDARRTFWKTAWEVCVCV